MKTSLKRICLFACLLVLGLCISKEALCQNFSTDGARLIDANGNEFIIKGMNNPHAWFGKKAYDALTAIERVGCNTVRIVWMTSREDADLEAIISRCIELKMIPMVELHDVTGNPSKDRLVDMARWYSEPSRVEMLRKYERYLLLNIANEWGDHKVSTAHWLDSYKEAVGLMRRAGYLCTLVVDAPGWGQNISPITQAGSELIQADSLHNILFSIHMYGSWNKSSRIEKELALCRELGLPMIVGEFGYNSSNGRNNLHCKVDHKTILSVCDKLGYGFMPWSWTGNNKANQWLDLVESSDWETLTRWGKEVILGPKGISATSKKCSVFTESTGD